MAAFFERWDVLLTSTLAEPPAAIGRFDHRSDDYVDYRLGPGRVFAYSPFTAAFNASGQPAASPQIAFRVTPDIRQRAADLAAREGKTISQLAREALEDRVAASQ